MIIGKNGNDLYPTVPVAWASCMNQKMEKYSERVQTLRGASYVEARRCDPDEYAQLVERCADPSKSRVFCSYISTTDVGSER